MKFIKNTTPYIGKIRLKFEKFPHYSSGSNYLNKIHLNLGFTKLVSRISVAQFMSDETLEIDLREYRPEVINSINNLTGGRISMYYVEGFSRKEGGMVSFIANDGTYMGSVAEGWWYVKNNFIISKKRPHGVAIKLKKPVNQYTSDDQIGDNEIAGYYGYSHRGGSLFKLGDRLFDEDYIPQESDYTRNEWKLFKRRQKKSIRYNLRKGYVKTKEDGLRDTPISSVINYSKRGNKIIETWEEAEQAAINMSRYLS